MSKGAPADIEALSRRARRLAGRTVAQIAHELGREVAADLRSHKGGLGSLIEGALARPGGSRPEVDFPELGVELKTLPIDRQGRPRESTWVCAALSMASSARGGRAPGYVTSSPECSGSLSSPSVASRSQSAA